MEIPIIIYQDEDLIVLNKPSGMIVNSSETTRNELTVQGWVENNFQFLSANWETNFKSNLKDQTYDPVEEFKSRGGIVHRLDKETSGALLVAKNPESFAALKEQFMTRTVKKIYLALAHGKILPEIGEINAPIGRQEFNRMRFGVVAGGREAVTEYKVLQQYVIAKNNNRHPELDSGSSQNSKKMPKQVRHDNIKSEILSLVELYPQTGRTHQIRVHLKHINNPIFGDELYAGRKTARDDRKLLQRFFLHASEIKFLHPKTKKEMTISVPLPEDLQKLLDSMGKYKQG